jgi:hypothetical protein
MVSNMDKVYTFLFAGVNTTHGLYPEQERCKYVGNLPG